MTIASEIQKLSPSAVIELFELHLQSEVMRFHAGTNEMMQPVVWQGQTYAPMPVEADGFDVTSRGQFPRPKLRVANIDGIISQALVGSDLSGYKVVRRRTMAKYLDSVNFAAGNPTADPTAEFPLDIYFIDRKSSETKSVIEFELASALDVTGMKLPRRQIIQNSCSWRYRGAECGYTGGPVADTLDEPVADISLDVCGKRLTSCKLRFGETAVLPYGGFPAAGLVRS